MTKNDLIARVANKTQFTQMQVKEMLKAAIESVKEALVVEKEVTIRGLGTLKVIRSAPRTGRNVRTNSVVKIPAKNRVKFKSYIDDEV